MRTSIVLIALLCAAFAAPADGAKRAVKTTVHATLWDESLGGMAYVTMPEGVWCAQSDKGRGWVYFSTDGADLSPIVAENNMRQAQLALTRSTALQVYIDDGRTRDDICLSYRTILTP